MTKVYDMLDWAALQGHVQRKEITERVHPEFLNLVIYNYADIVAFQKLWTPETRAARGLIVDLETYDVLARPFSKFFNYGQEEGVNYELDTRLYHVGNKFDGSLGIGYIRPDGQVAIATRGSFESDQAKHATNLVAQEPSLAWDIREAIRHGRTPLFEIIYPENRIVLSYGDADYLQYLGEVSIDTGAYMPSKNGTEGKTFRSVLAIPDRPNSEGWVVWFDPYTAVKIKQEDYIALHRIVTGLNRKSIWRALSEGYDVYLKLAEQLPDELFKWAQDVAQELNEQYAQIMRDADRWYIDAVIALDDMPGGEFDGQDFDRKKFATWVAANVPSEYRGYVFGLLDGKDIMSKIWKQIEPFGGEK